MAEAPDEVRVEVVVSSEAAAEAAALFDDPVDEEATIAFLADERHHLLVGYIGGQPAGFVTGVELLHPDKPRPEMFLYELEVAPAYRRRGVARALMQRLVHLCHERACGEMFTLTGEENEAAQATYRAAWGEAEPAGIMFHWDWSGGK
jgi:ribosomal protein S18 acetylase RimI-like enzyme